MRQPAMDDIIDVIGNRWNMLEALHGNPLTKPELETVLGVSRSTVNRAVSELEQAGLIQRSPPEGYQITAFGHPIYHLCLRTGRCLSGMYEAHQLGLQLPSGEHGEVTVFDEPTISQPNAHEPDRPLKNLLDRIREARIFRGYSPVVLNQYVDVCYEQARQKDLELELAITSTVRECLETSYKEQLEETLYQTDVNIYETLEQLPFGIAIFYDGSTWETALVLYSETGVSGLVINDNHSALGWAQQIYEILVHQGSEIEPTQIQNRV